MTNYIRDTLLRFKHTMPRSPQLSPHEHILIQYGIKSRKYALEPDTSPLLQKDRIKYVQKVTGSLLYYARNIDGTMLPALNTIASEQVSQANKTKMKYEILLDYATTYQDAYTRHYASNMILTVD